MLHEKLTYAIRGAAFKVHKALGPGLMESAYEACLVHELKETGLQVQHQLEVPLLYRGIHVKSAYKLDVLVDNKVILELKAVDTLAPIFTAQLLTYMRLSDIRLGLLINFNVENLQQGIKRYII